MEFKGDEITIYMYELHKNAPEEKVAVTKTQLKKESGEKELAPKDGGLKE